MEETLNKKLTIIGAGKMAEAILKGIVDNKIISPINITVTDIDGERLNLVKESFGVNTSMNNPSSIDGADLVLLAIKPQVVPSLLQEIYPILTTQLLISIIAGITLKNLDIDNKLRVCRLMPNTPAIVGEAMTAISYNDLVTAEDKEITNYIFSSIGETIEIPEKLQNSVTALSGSGPAFVFRLLEAFIEGGMNIGLDFESAKKLTFQTFKGSSILAERSEQTLQSLVQAVSSPGGTTVAGRDRLENSDYKDIINKTLLAAKSRADELSKG